MKKGFIISGIIVVLIMGSLLAIPFIFKEALLEKTKATINRQINAKVDFSAFNLSLIRHFPKVTVELENVSVKGIEKFSEDTLLAIPSFRTRFSLSALFNRQEMAIEELMMDKPFLNLKVDTLGNVNWNIIKDNSGTSGQVKPNKESNPFRMALKKINIADANIFYHDLEMPMLLSLTETQIELSGKMFGSATELQGEANVGNFILNYDSITYISNSTFKTFTTLNIDFEQWIFRINKSECWINLLPFELNGDFSMPGDSLLFNLDFNAKRTGLNDFLALTPPDYEKYMQDVTTEGNADFKGYFKGLLHNEEYPAFSFDFNIKDGKINYTSLPEKIENISADVSIWKPQGKLDLMKLSIKNTHAEIAGNPADISASISNIYSDTNFDLDIKGKFNFTKLKNAVPVENFLLDGIIDVDVFAKGKYSDVELKNYENLQTEGEVILTDVSYAGSGLKNPVKIPVGYLSFSPMKIVANNFKIIVGNSDLSLTGNISNYLRYFLYDGTLAGELNLNSENLDINELITLLPNDTISHNSNLDSPAQISSNKQKTSFSIPTNYDFKINASVKKSIYEELPMSGIRLNAFIKNGRISANNLSALAGGSEIKLNGFYESSRQKAAQFSLGGSINSLDFTVLKNSLPTLKELIPVASDLTGKADLQLQAKGEYESQINVNSVEGMAILNDFSYTDPSLSLPVRITKGKLGFNLEEMELSQLNVIIGGTDLSLNGKISNFLDYYDSKGVLSGNIQLKSNLFNANELINLKVPEAKSGENKPALATNESNPDLKAFTIPSNIKLNFNTAISRAVYDKINISSVEGAATVSEGKLDLKGLSMNMLDGELKLNGSYTNKADNQPNIDFGFAIQNFDIPSSFKFLKTFQNKIPVTKNGQGKFSSNLSMKGMLTSDLKFDFPSINGNGLFSTSNFQLIDAKIFEKLETVIKKEKLKNVNLDNFTTEFTIKNGGIDLNPFQTKIAGQEVKISGNINAQNLVNLKLDFNIHREVFGPDIQKLLTALPGQEKIQLLPATVTISGPVKDPTMGINLDAAKKMIADEAKKSAADKIKDQINKIGDVLKK